MASGDGSRKKRNLLFQETPAKRTILIKKTVQIYDKLNRKRPHQQSINHCRENTA
jgi:hypothetical protein